MRRTLGLAATIGTLALVSLLYWRGTPEPDPRPESRFAPPRPAVAQAPIPTEHMPPPFADRKVAKPDPAAPLPSETAAFCDDGNWSRIDLGITRSADGEYRVDVAAWNRALTDTKAGLASWMSQCHQNGGPVTIVADSTGARLATYDPQSGLQLNGL